MEIELKYFLNDNLAKERILGDRHLAEMIDPEGNETIKMRAVYFDTEEGDLGRIFVALRARCENDRIIVTLKWKGSVQDGLHVRGELNVPSDEAYFDNPTVEVFRGSEIFDQLEKAVSGKKLVPVMEMEYVRKSVKVDTGASISVISLDEGLIRAAGKETEILEVEIELYSGDQNDMIALGNELASKYNLAASDQSKFQRGLELIKAD
ncbi:MAG: CYTH domain-containing protein [Firmicutes bacterium]|nr:CYTH domain-containing protein [Bacillota bacterium]